MAVFRLRTPREDEPRLRYTVNLEGTFYVLQFDWNERQLLWSMDIFDSDNVPLIRGQACVANWEFLRVRVVEGLPPGRLFLYTADGLPPQLQTFRDAELFYFDSEEG